MSRYAGKLILLAVVVNWPVAVQAQYPSELVGFNGPPIDDPATCQEMFQSPQFSGSTSGYILPNDPGQFNNNAAFRASGMQTEGVAALQAFFNWVDPFDPHAWVRLTTFNGPERPNPSLHTQGKVRFKLTNRSELFQGEIGVCLGIRETGVVAPQLGNGGTSGPIEWVGVTGVIPDPNDPGRPIAPIPAITLPPAPVAYVLEWDLSTGVVKVNGTPHGGGIAGFTGDGVLSAPNNRGTLEHIAITSTADGATLIDFAIDELQFEAPEPDPVPPPTVVAPILVGDTEVTVTDLIATVDNVKLYVNGDLVESRDVAGPEDVVFTIAPAVAGDAYTATQRDGQSGVESPPSAPVVVTATYLVVEYELSPTLAGLSRSISADDLINGRIGTLEGGDVDPANGVYAWNMNSGSACLEMANTVPSPGFHPATPGGTAGGLADLTDGVAGSIVEAVLADFYRAALVVRYDFDPPVNISEIVVFAANEDPGAPRNGRIFQHYDVWSSSDNLATFQPVVLGVKTGEFGDINDEDNRATFTRVYDAASGVLASRVTNLRFVFYGVSNTAGRFQDQWQGNANEDPAYRALCPQTEPEDTDGFRKAFEAPIIKEIDVFGAAAGVPGDLDGDGDVDLADLATLLSNYGLTGGAEYEDGDIDGDGDVDLADLAILLSNYGTGP